MESDLRSPLYDVAACCRTYEVSLSVNRCSPSAAVGLLRTAMRRSAGAVSIITAGTGPERTGMTVTSALSLSMAPPTMMVAVDRGASTWPILEAAGSFAVNIPSATQIHVAERFAGRDGAKGAARYAGSDWFRLGSGSFGLVGALAVIDCRIEEIIERHSHAIVLGAVLDVHLGSEPAAESLVYAAGAFGRVEVTSPA